MAEGRLQGRVALVSGAGSGIGQGIAELFAAEGAKVALVDIDASSAATTAERIRAAGGDALVIQADVSNEEHVRSAVKETVSELGGLHHLVNNAGIVLVKPMEENSLEEWEHVMSVNVTSVFLMTKHALRALRKTKNSTIVNLGSISSYVAQANTASYVTSKAAVTMLTKAMALEYARFGIRVNAVCPGITDTPLFRHHVGKTPDPKATLAARAARVPLGRFLTPLDIAKAALYLSTEDSSGITGIAHVVDAGYLSAGEWDSRLG